VEHLRTSEAERQRVVAFLRDECAEGRLEPDELEERAAAALRSRTRGELVVLVADLPGAAAALPGGAGGPGARAAGLAPPRPSFVVPARRGSRRPLAAVGVLLALLVAAPFLLPAPELLILTFAAVVLATIVSLVLISVAPWLAAGAAVVWLVERARGRALPPPGPGGEEDARSP
jgi:hypothetical protein